MQPLQSMDYEIQIATHSNFKSVLELRTRFFKYHTSKDIPNHPRGIEPISLVLNPPTIIDEGDPFCIDTWFALYYKQYYVKIEQSHTSPITGPHKATLHIQAFPARHGLPGKHEWIGTATFRVPFTNEEQIRIALRKAIRTRQYFVGEKTEEIMIDMNAPEDNRIIASI